MEGTLVYVTAADEAAAHSIATTIVGEHLAACANILPPIRSVYWWQGALEEATEVALLLKTRAALVPMLIERVKELHAYDCPCIVALPIVAGNPAFLDWIANETRA